MPEDIFVSSLLSQDIFGSRSRLCIFQPKQPSNNKQILALSLLKPKFKTAAN